MNFLINNTPYNLEVEGDMPILWVLRDILQMTGTKFGCGIAQCGACTVHLNGQAIRSCITPISSAEEMNITTIEGLSETENALQKAWMMEDVPQCGYVRIRKAIRLASKIQKEGEVAK
jgi:isoquinoline 1-oxidoreductase alpha subunit